MPSLNSVHVLCRFTFSYPAMNFSFCRFTHHPSHTTLSHTPSFATPSFTHHFVTHHLFQTTLSHALFHTHTQLSHTHTHHLSHTTLSHTTIFLCHTPSFTYNFVTHNFVLLLDPPPPPSSFLPSPLWGYPVLNFFWVMGLLLWRWLEMSLKTLQKP